MRPKKGIFTIIVEFSISYRVLYQRAVVGSTTTAEGMYLCYQH
jgi:hypothetical protein